MPPTTNILLIGGGGREHALAWKLRQSPRCGTLWVSHPDNPGLASLAKPVDVPVDVKQAYRVQRFCEKNDIGLVVIGPEEPLAAGMADILQAPGRVVFGPTADAARLEADKAWCKSLIRGASVPMAEGRAFSDHSAAKAYVESREDPPVIKASGLAAGKGVVVPESIDEALKALDRMMVRLEFGDAGRTVVVEERLEGREVSILALTDGRTIYILEPCQDYKRLADNDTGPNTGGMGAVCPVGGVGGGGGLDDATIQIIQSQILVPTLDALRRDGIDYRGVLYAGIMLTPAGPKVLEFNCRFGDPECQALMVRLDTDLIDILLSIGHRRLEDTDIRWSPAASCCVVLASAGYPGKPRTGDPISGLDEAQRLPGIQIFLSGVRRSVPSPATAGVVVGGVVRGAARPGEPTTVTAGGRVVCVTAAADSPAAARANAYRACGMISFEGRQMRTDIGASNAAVSSATT